MVVRDHTWEWTLPPRQMGAILASLGLGRFGWGLMASPNSHWCENFIGEYQDLFAIVVRNWVGSSGTAWVCPPITVMRQTAKWLNTWVKAAASHREVRIVFLAHPSFCTLHEFTSWYKVCAVKLKNPGPSPGYKECEEISRRTLNGRWIVLASFNFRKRGSENGFPQEYDTVDLKRKRS